MKIISSHVTSAALFRKISLGKFSFIHFSDTGMDIRISLLLSFSRWQGIKLTQEVLHELGCFKYHSSYFPPSQFHFSEMDEC